MADGVWDIVVGVQNKQELDELNRTIEAGEKKILAYKAAMDAGKITQEMYVGSARSVAMSIEQASGRIQEITGHAENLGKAGAKAGYGLLQLGYAADDIQYGFKSIVNNIPQIALGLGAGAGLAGAASVAAVATNLLINKWEDLLRVFNETPYSIQGAKSAMESITEGIGDFGLIGPGGGGFMRQVNQIGAAQSAVDEKKARDAARGKGLRDKFDDLATKDQQKQGGLFKEALAEYGPERLQGRLEAQLKKGKGELSPQQERNIADFATNLIADALKGKTKATEYEKLFGSGFTDQYEKTLHDSEAGKRKKELAKIDADAEKEVKEEEAKRKRVEANLDKATDRAIRQEEEEKRASDMERQFRKEAEIDALQDKQRVLREQAQDIHNKPRSQIFSGTKAFADHQMAGSMETLSKQKLAEAKLLNQKIEALRADLKNDRQGARLAR